MRASIVVQGMRGLGDCIYQRPFVRTLVERGTATVYVETPWPELYEDLPVRFLHASTTLRTQARNVAGQPAGRWSHAPQAPVRRIRVAYGSAALRAGSIVAAMEGCFGVPPAAWDLPAFPRFERDRPVAVVRPVTERREWLNAARGPLPEYVAEVAADLMRDYHVVSVADVVDGVEWIVGDPPPAHERLHAGELGVRALLGLIQSATVVVGGVGWIVPASIAAGVPAFVINGGQGAHNARDRITDPRMPLDRIAFVEPDRFCRCENMRHACDKRIADLSARWSAFRRQRGL